MPKAKQHIISESERETLVQEKRELESAITSLEKDEFGKGTAAEQIDKGAIRAQIKKLDTVIHAGSAPKLKGSDKDHLAKEAAQLAEKIQEGMPTRDEMRRPLNYPGVIRKNQEWEKRNRGNIERWKQVQRTLEGGNASNVESLRRG